MTNPLRVVLAAAFLLSSTTALAAPTAPRAPATSTVGSAEPMRLGVLPVLELETENGYGIRGDVELLPLAQLGNGATLKLLGSLGWTRYSVGEGGFDVTSNVFRFIPGVRLTFPLQNKLGVYADGGVGLYHARVSAPSVTVGGLTFDPSTSETSFMLRVAGGGYYDVTPSVRLLAEVGYLPHFGDFDMNPISISAGASFAF